MTYLACPYSSESAMVRNARFESVNHAAAKLMREGVKVFSPISHSHPIAQCGDLPKDWDFWRDYDTEFLSMCERLIVLKLDGWKESVGVQAEIAIAERLGLKIEYMEAE